MGKLFLLFGLGLFALITNPDKRRFREALESDVYHSVICGLAPRSSLNLNIYTIKSYYFFSLAFIGNNDIFENERVVAFGVFGEWFFA